MLNDRYLLKKIMPGHEGLVTLDFKDNIIYFHNGDDGSCRLNLKRLKKFIKTLQEMEKLLSVSEVQNG